MIVVAFRDDLDTADINEAVERIREMVKKEFSLVRYVLVQPEFYKQEPGKLKIE